VASIFIEDPSLATLLGPGEVGLCAAADGWRLLEDGDASFIGFEVVYDGLVTEGGPSVILLKPGLLFRRTAAGFWLVPSRDWCIGRGLKDCLAVLMRPELMFFGT